MLKIQNSQMLYKKTANQIARRANMTRSQLELYGEVLQALAKKRLTIDSIAFECSTDCVFLSQRLAFLAKCGLVQEESHRNKTFYALTRRGIAVSNTLAVTRHLEKLKISPEITE